MKDTAALGMVVEVLDHLNGNVYTKIIVSNDVSTTRATVSYPQSNEYGMFPTHIIETIFKAEPGHIWQSICFFKGT